MKNHVINVMLVKNVKDTSNFGGKIHGLNGQLRNNDGERRT